MELRLQLPFDAGQVYGLTFSAPRHRPAWQLVRRLDFIRIPEQVEGDDLILRLMLVPDSPGTTDLPQGLERLQQIASPFAAPGTGIDAATFQALDVAAKMAFLNIEAKLRETVIDGAPLMSFVRGVRHVAVDRVFLLFDAGAEGADAARESILPERRVTARRRAFPICRLIPTAGSTRGLPKGTSSCRSRRTRCRFPAAAPSSLVHSADVDIDLGRGLAHAKEWLENNVFRPGHKTNQALVYALLYAQGILPQYTLDPAPATTLRVRRRGSGRCAPRRAEGAARSHGDGRRAAPSGSRRAKDDARARPIIPVQSEETCLSSSIRPGGGFKRVGRVPRGRARRGAPVCRVCRPEFLTAESRVAEEVVLEPAPPTRGRGGRPPPALDLSYDLEPGQTAILAIRHPSGALTFHPPVQSTSRGRARAVAGAVPGHRAADRHARPDREAIKAIVIKVAKVAADKAVSFAAARLAEALEKAAVEEARAQGRVAEGHEGHAGRRRARTGQARVTGALPPVHPRNVFERRLRVSRAGRFRLSSIA